MNTIAHVYVPTSHVMKLIYIVVSCNLQWKGKDTNSFLNEKCNSKWNENGKVWKRRSI